MRNKIRGRKRQNRQRETSFSLTLSLFESGMGLGFSKYTQVEENIHVRIVGDAVQILCLDKIERADVGLSVRDMTDNESNLSV